MSKSNELIKRAIDSGDYVATRNGDIIKLIDKEGHNVKNPVPAFKGIHKANGRQRVRLYNDKVYLHRVMAYAFFGELAFEMEVHHIDGNALNNEIKNLSLVTRGYHLKVLHAGEGSKSSKLKWAEVNEIRKLWNTKNYTKAQLARLYNVSDYTINQIIKNLSWKESIDL